MNDYGNGMQMEGMGGEMPEENDEELLAELLEAAQAGDDAEGEGFFSEVPGTEQEGGGMKLEAEASDVSPEQLQALLEALKGGSDNGMG